MGAKLGGWLLIKFEEAVMGRYVVIDKSLLCVEGCFQSMNEAINFVQNHNDRENIECVDLLEVG